MLGCPGEIPPQLSRSKKGKLRSEQWRNHQPSLHSSEQPCSPLADIPRSQHGPVAGIHVWAVLGGRGGPGRGTWCISSLTNGPQCPLGRCPGSRAGLSALALALEDQQMGSISRDYLDISKGLRHDPLNLDKQA